MQSLKNHSLKAPALATLMWGAIAGVATGASAQTLVTEQVITQQRPIEAVMVPGAINPGVPATPVQAPGVAPAPATESARVVSVTPVLQQSMVPQTTCSTEAVSPGASSGAGAVVGALAGAAIGSTMGGGSGNALATAIGFLGGAALGNQAEAQGNTQVTRRCVTQNVGTSVTVFNVVFEYAGKQYSTQMARDPGPTVLVQVTPVGTVSTQTGSLPAAGTQTIVTTTTATPVVNVYDPYYYPRFYPNVVFSVGYPIRRGHRHW